MSRPARPRTVRALGALGAAALVAVALTAAATGSSARPDHPAGGRQRAESFAVIGDIPYGDAQIANFPKVVAQLNADRASQWVAHLGDIKSGSTVCSDEYFAMIRQRFDSFTKPLVYTPGDNEWTDCHRPNNGGYDPLERLAKVRQVFFDRPGTTLGQRTFRVASQADRGVPENVLFRRAGVTFVAPDIPGSDNSLLPWTGKTAPTAAQLSEVLDRTSADIDLVEGAFATARAHHDRAVAILTQADMFDPTVTDPTYDEYSGYQAIVRTLVRESQRFDGQVYLFNGDSHVYNEDHPLAAGSPWLSLYDVPAVTNLTRTTVDGSTGVDDYLRVTVHPKGPRALTWERVPFAG